MNGSIGKNATIMIIVLFVICIFMNNKIKLYAMESSIDEELIKNLIVGEYNLRSENSNEYVICTKDNVENIVITNKYVSWIWFSYEALVDFDVTLKSGGEKIKTTGFLNMKFNTKEPLKWSVNNGNIRGGEALTYE